MNTEKTTTSEIAKSAPKAPATLRDMLNSTDFSSAIARALPKHMTADRFMRVALTTVLKTPKLAECSQASVLQSMLTCSQLGIEPDGRLAHLIPYGNVCQLILDYKALIQLAKRSGEVVSWSGELVKENDEFSWTDGMVTHKIDWTKPRGKTLAVYSRVKLKSGEFEFEVMTDEECEAIRKRSRAGNNGPWISDRDEMMKKTAIRRHSKRLTLSPEFRDAVEADDDVIDLVPRQTARTEPLLPFALPEGEATATDVATVPTAEPAKP